MKTHSFVRCLDRYPVWICLAFCAWLTSACGQTATATAGSRRIEWLGRPWELQYVLYVTDRWTLESDVVQKRALKAGTGRLDRAWEEVFTPSVAIPLPEKWVAFDDRISVLLIEFDRDGKVKTPNSYGAQLYGRLDRLMYVTLSPGDYSKQPRFDLGEWFMGLGDVSTHWAPGLCDVHTMPNPFAKTDTGYLYGPVFTPSLGSSNFGCREWAYQLGDPNRPYIDITSYFAKKEDPDGSGTHVYQTMGWSRFNDERKPVIGKNEEDWYCFHDCPGGDKPGFIPDIKAWAKKHRWPVPKRPTRIPVFPDPPAKQGVYP
jgi:hypothetical protein